MKLLFILTLFITSSSGLDIPDIGGLIKDIPLPLDISQLNPAKILELFTQFRKEFVKNYANPAEEAKALATFGDNLKKIIELNLKFKDKNVEYGINQFTDLTEKEFSDRVLMKEPPVLSNATIFPADSHKAKLAINWPLPSVDWRTNKAVVGSVKNQGSCGCCWAFTAAVLITGANGIKYGTLKEPSEQQICECALGAGQIGCNGGWIDKGLDYARIKGVSSVAGYTPYNPSRATVANTCTDTSSPNSIRLNYVYQIMPPSAITIRDFIYYYGPIGVAFSVGSSFQFYKSGIFNNNDCTTNSIGWHAVAVVGYNIENGIPYWIIKNSWGTSWGESGYVRYYRGTDLCKLETTVANFATAA